MRRSGNVATMAEQVPITPDHSELIMCEFGADGRLVRFGVVRGNLRHETPEGEHARLLLEQLNAKLSRAGSLQEMLRRARLALDLVENLAALEAMHGAEARQLLTESPAPSGSR